VLASGGGAARLVNDESILTTRALTLDGTGDILGQYLRKAAKSNLYNAEDEVEESKAAIRKGLFCRIPVHAYILMFHLELHHYVWVHVDDVTPYALLTAEMDILMDDIIAGKSGGTTVLCAGRLGSARP
jgi:hypothetical protein